MGFLNLPIHNFHVYIQTSKFLQPQSSLNKISLTLIIIALVITSRCIKQSKCDWKNVNIDTDNNSRKVKSRVFLFNLSTRERNVCICLNLKIQQNMIDDIPLKLQICTRNSTARLWKICNWYHLLG
jgi:hypothetical protein